MLSMISHHFPYSLQFGNQFCNFVPTCLVSFCVIKKYILFNTFYFILFFFLLFFSIFLQLFFIYHFNLHVIFSTIAICSTLSNICFFPFELKKCLFILFHFFSLYYLLSFWQNFLILYVLFSTSTNCGTHCYPQPLSFIFDLNPLQTRV